MNKKFAGIDFGLSCVKACWTDNEGIPHFVWQPNHRREYVVESLQKAGITDLRVAGQGNQNDFEAFTKHSIAPPTDNPLFYSEILPQIIGAVKLLRNIDKIALGERYMVVSIGTGTSYVRVDNYTYDSPLGNSIGAGTVAGLMRSWGLTFEPAIDTLLTGETYDLLYKDVIAAMGNSPLGERPVSHFAKCTNTGCKEWLVGSAVQMLVIGVLRDLYNFDAMAAYDQCKEIIVVGTLPARSQKVRDLLIGGAAQIGKKLYIPTYAEYALAYGIYHSISNMAD